MKRFFNVIGQTVKTKLLPFLLLLLLVVSVACSPAAPVDTETRYETKTEEKQETAEQNKETKEEIKEDEPSQKPSSTQKPTETPSPEGEKKEDPVSSSSIPAYSGQIFVSLNDGKPNFSAKELSTTAYESYSRLDSLGRVGAAFAICGTEIMPAKGEERGSISHIKPTGWEQAKYDFVSGKYIYNRCHLIGWQLSAENDNEKNLITGTRSFNTEGMLPFENMIADYIRETGNHVAYRVTPVFEGDNLLATGVRMEAWSVEDDGEGISFHVFVYNVEDGVKINYANGKTTLASPAATPATTTKAVTTTTKAPTTTTKAPATTTKAPTTTTKAPTGGGNGDPDGDDTDGSVVYRTPGGKRYHIDPQCGGKNSTQVTLDAALKAGLTPCKTCIGQ